MGETWIGVNWWLWRKRSGKLDTRSNGAGTTSFLGVETFEQATGGKLANVAYKGSGPAVSDLLAGQVDMMLDTGSLAQVKGGALRALAVASKERVPALPDVPTFAEAGIKDMYAAAWYGVMAPANTPPEIVTRLNTEINAILAEPEVRDTIINLGAEMREGQSPAQFQAFVTSEIVRFKGIVEMSGAKME